ncbi:MAG: GDSL-type esterase/lipase family protein [Patescibacteria group bacterium]
MKSFVMILSISILSLAIVTFIGYSAPVYSQSPPSIGIMSDSNSDEYRADDNRGGIYAATTLNWVEILVRERNFNVGIWGTRSEPRRSGYAYNWARSGATANTMISVGQHWGLAQQVASGLINTVVLQIGGNDFAWYRSDGYEPIYSGTLIGNALQQKLEAIVTDITTAVETVLAAGQVKFLLVSVPDQNLSPVVLATFPDPVKRARVGEAISYVNSKLQLLAQEKGISYIDMNSYYLELQATRGNPDGSFTVGGEVISMSSFGDEPHHGILGDQIHGGTVIEGLLATKFISLINELNGTNILPLSDSEILSAAGILSCTDSDQNGKVNALDFGKMVRLNAQPQLLRSVISNWLSACI